MELELLRCVSNIDLDLIEHLIVERGVSPNVAAALHTAYEGHTPLSYAARRGHAGVVDGLLRHGADVHMRTLEAGGTALHEAAGYGHTDVCRLLLGHGADPCSVCTHSPYDTPLSLSRAHNHPLCTALLDSERRRRTVAVITSLQSLDTVMVPVDILTLCIQMRMGQLGVGAEPI